VCGVSQRPDNYGGGWGCLVGQNFVKLVGVYEQTNFMCWAFTGD